MVAATEGEIRARFRAAASEVIGMERADAAEEMIDGLERLDHAGRIAALCASGHPAANRAPRHPARARGRDGRAVAIA